MRALRLGQDRPQRSGGLGVLDPGPQKLGPPDDDGQGIVQLVRGPGGELSQGFQLVPALRLLGSIDAAPEGLSRCIQQSEQGIAVGPGRGSAAGSLVAYCLGITTVDPIRYGLLFERFLNPGRKSMPDMDIDFADDRRDEVIEYVVRKYGRERVAQIITFNVLKAKAVIRDVGRVLGMPFGDVDRIVKFVPDTLNISLDDALRQSPDLAEAVNREGGFNLAFDYSYDADGHPDNFYCRSDHYMYARYGIPITFFSTGGHRDYHQVTDELEYLDFDKYARVTSFVRAVAERVANLDHRVVVDKPKPDPDAPCHQ